jgi:undecaprenyl diphosphate synthase
MKVIKEGREVDEPGFARHLWSAGMPDPDIIIRTGGRRRISNFLLWQAAYAELFFLDSMWPDFRPETLDAVLEEYAARVRTYGL